MKFYRCEHCGNIVTFVHNSGVPVICCGEKMKELQAGVTDATQEKHVPVVEKVDNKVTVRVGSVAHPMFEEHYIEFIALETTEGEYVKYLKAGDEPAATFVLADGEDVIAAYEYCNLHGLWKK